MSVAPGAQQVKLLRSSARGGLGAIRVFARSGLERDRGPAVPRAVRVSLCLQTSRCPGGGNSRRARGGRAWPRGGAGAESAAARPPSVPGRAAAAGTARAALGGEFVNNRLALGCLTRRRRPRRLCSLAATRSQQARANGAHRLPAPGAQGWRCPRGGGS